MGLNLAFRVTDDLALCDQQLLQLGDGYGARFDCLLDRLMRGDSGGLPRSTGLISASSTAGAIVGSLGAGLFVLPQLGFERTLAALCGFLAALA